MDCVRVLYSGESVLYTAPISFPSLYDENDIPSFANESIDSADASLNSFSQYSTNFSLPTSNGENLNFFSAAISIWSPFLSKPNGNRTSWPFILRYLAKKSMKQYVTACPMWIGELMYGGGVSIE